MDSRKWLTVLALAALAACAVARPGSENDIANADNILSNDVASKEVVHAKTEDATQKSEKLVDADSKPVTVQAEAKPEEAKLEESKDAAPKTVNELNPHAVLFGGTCGGSIISPKWILTAGHCTIFSGGRYVLAGTNNSYSGTGVERRVKRLIIHPRFSVGPYWLDADDFDIKQVAADWDFLLAELEEPLPLDGKTMAAVELDDQPTLPEGLEVGYAGCGAARHGETMREDMHAMELQVMPDSACKEKLVQYDPEAMLCTKGRAPRYDSACNGDSGSGLVANGKLYGIASWVENDSHTCFNGALVVFSRVGAVRDWIRQVTKI